MAGVRSVNRATRGISNRAIACEVHRNHMKGCPLAGHYYVRTIGLTKETAMGTQSVSHMGLDCHKNFSRVTARDEQGRVVWRGRLEHGNRQELKVKLAG